MPWKSMADELTSVSEPSSIIRPRAHSWRWSDTRSTVRGNGFELIFVKNPALSGSLDEIELEFEEHKETIALFINLVFRFVPQNYRS